MGSPFVGAAFKLRSGKILITGCFHDIDMVPDDDEIAEEGFVDINGFFYNRQQASDLLKKTNIQSQEIFGCK